MNNRRGMRKEKEEGTAVLKRTRETGRVFDFHGIWSGKNHGWTAFLVGMPPDRCGVKVT